jgi:ADP-dependent NAD(P)H-hydrate dehydratase / NAD(P)H-hydrate epimerase
MEILTSAEMSATDRRTAEEFGVPLAELMENAGAAVAGFSLRQYSAVERVVVLCGKGNNGGDGLVAARVLATAGLNVEVVLLGRVDEVKGEAAVALRRLRTEAAEVALREVVDEAGLTGAGSAIVSAELVIDAVVGTGFKPPLRGLVGALREMVEKATAVVVAVDIPSGWDADSMEMTGVGAFRADAVVTFTRPKMAHVFGSLTGGAFGPVVVAEIGSRDAAVVSASGLTWAGSAKTIAERPRDVNSNKGMYGHVLVVGGSYGTAGAPSMASLAALRTGAGLVTAAVPECVADVVAGIAPELMMRPLWQSDATLRQEGYGVPSESNFESARLEELLKGIKVVAIGPGLSTRPGASEFAREFVAKVKLPMVVDADALNAFEGRAAELNGEGRVMVLTPHPGEMARLAGMTIKEVEADRAGLARRFAMEHKLTLVLKGWRTLVAHPDGRIAVNTSGNPAMAKGGSGDILTGIVAAMLAQYAGAGDADDVARAVEAAVYLHGLAGDFAARAMDDHTVLATDTVAHLSDAFRYRVKDAGMTWLCGVRE